MDRHWFESDPERMPLGRLVSWTGQSLARYYQRTVAAHGLSATAMAVLGALAHADALSHRELAGRLGVTPATLTPVVDALAVRGDVIRQRDRDDRRQVRLSITDRGRDGLAAAFAAVAGALRERMPQPSPDERRVIRAYLLAVLAAVDTDGSP